MPWNRTPRVAHDDDASLVTRVAAGDARALDLLYRREAGPVYRYALALSGNAAWAADATQEAFVALATRPQGYDAARGALGAWLAGVARHALAALWREGRLEDPLPEDDAAAALDAHGEAASPEALLVRRQDSAAFWAALRAIATPYREALVLVDLQERPYAEAAAIAGIELNTLRTRLHRARGKLAALLNAARRREPVMTEHGKHDTPTTLTAALRSAGDELRALQPPAALQARIRAALPADAARPPRRALWLWSGAGAFAAVLLGSALLVLRPAPPLAVDDGLRFGAFIRVAPAERWPAGESEAWLVRTEMPEERLAALGLPYDPARAGESVRAELLMHPSGEVLAVRFVP